MNACAAVTLGVLLLATAALAVWNVGIAVIFGILVHHGVKRRWMGV